MRLRQKCGEIQGSEDAVVERSNLIDPGREGALYEEANPGYLLSAGKKVVFSAGGAAGERRQEGLWLAVSC